MKNYSLRFIVTMLVLLVGGIQAQDITISGVVKEAGSDFTVPGATILLLGTDNGTITDFDGAFSLSVPSLEDTLQLSFIGYETLTLPIDGRTNLDVYMDVQSNELDEIVVVGYGRQKKRLVTGAISRVDNEEITSTPTLRVEQALQGRTPGVQVTSLSGQPGEEPTVRVRGIGTTVNSKPLYIVDGLAVGGIDYLNPGDIETIDVLKDAASASIYGSRAANGVVLITTKSGQSGKSSVSFDSYYGLQNATNTLDVLNADQYRLIMNEGARNAGLSEPFDLNEIPAFDTDWQAALFQTNAPIQNHQVSITGGNDKSTYASSFSVFSQEGIIGGPKSQFDRITGRINSTHKVSKMFSFGNNLAYTHLTRSDIGSNTSFNGAYSSALNLDPLTPLIETRDITLNNYPLNAEPVVTNADGQPYGISEYVGAEIVNPLALLDIDFGSTAKDEIVGNLFGDFSPLEGLKFHSSIGVNLAYVTFDNFIPLFFLNGAQLNTDKNSVSKEIQRFFTWQWNNTVSYDKEVGNSSFGFLVGTEAIESRFDNLSGFNRDAPDTDPNNVFLNLAIDTTDLAGGGANESALFSIFSRANYSYKDKYSVTAIVRRDGSSRFGPNNRFGIFPSVGLAWVASDEEFLNNLGPLNFLKFRAGWGVNGNQEIGDFQFLSRLISNNNYTFGGGVSVGTSPLSIENQDIMWEESEQYNLGADFGAFENRLQGSVDFYVKNTNGLLETIAIPGHVGNNPSVSNAGSISNRGIELSLNWQNQHGGFKYNVGINGAVNKNEVTLIANPEKIIPGASWALAGTVTRSVEGLPLAHFFGFQTDGLFQNERDVISHINNDGNLLQPRAVPGDVRFVDTNGDGTINDDDRTILGNPTPDVTFGFNLGAEYYGFDFSVFFQGALGHEIFNGTQRQDLRFTNRTTAILDRWTGEGTSNSEPRFTFTDTNNNYRASDLYIEDGSYVRLKNIQIGYSLPNGILNKVGAEKWRFYISGENLLTLTNYTGVDPEIGAQSSFDIGIDRGVYPQASTVRFGTSLTF